MDKILKGEGKNLYCCFVDVKKAFNFKNRNMLFSKLLSDFGVCGNFLKCLLDIKTIRGSKECVSKFLDKRIKSCFDRFWLDQINQEKNDINGIDHNKLRFYKQLKGTFGLEPYIENVLNRSQRAWLTRFRVSAVANLRIECGRWTRPVTPLENRKCQYYQYYRKEERKIINTQKDQCVKK